jgi:hypothetical protein
MGVGIEVAIAVVNGKADGVDTGVGRVDEVAGRGLDDRRGAALVTTAAANVRDGGGVSDADGKAVGVGVPPEPVTGSVVVADDADVTAAGSLTLAFVKRVTSCSPMITAKIPASTTPAMPITW